MTRNELMRATALDAVVAAAYDEPGVERRELEQWASAIAGCLQQAAPVRSPALGLGNGEPPQGVPDAWRPSVEVLTPSTPSNSASGNRALANATPGATAPVEATRLQVRVRTAELGEVAVVVERVEAGLRVLLGVSDAKAIAALQRDARSVLQALETDGQTIKSLEIVRMNGLGTDLALSKVAPGQRARPDEKTADSDTHTSQRRRKTKKLDVTG